MNGTENGSEKEKIKKKCGKFSKLHKFCLLFYCALQEYENAIISSFSRAVNVSELFFRSNLMLELHWRFLVV